MWFCFCHEVAKQNGSKWIKPFPQLFFLRFRDGPHGAERFSAPSLAVDLLGEAVVSWQWWNYDTPSVWGGTFGASLKALDVHDTSNLYNLLLNIDWLTDLLYINAAIDRYWWQGGLLTSSVNPPLCSYIIMVHIPTTMQPIRDVHLSDRRKGCLVWTHTYTTQIGQKWV